MAESVSIPARLLMGVIYFYRYTLSYFIGRHCRFAPSCSEYGLEALRRHGAGRGGMLALRRILRCHPWGGSGYDPVPEAEQSEGQPESGPKLPPETRPGSPPRP